MVRGVIVRSILRSFFSIIQINHHIRWQDLNATRAARLDQQLLTGIVCFGIILAVAQVVSFADRLHYLGAAFCIAGMSHPWIVHDCIVGTPGNYGSQVVVIRIQSSLPRAC
jgi:hypothetical protein